MIKKVWKSLKFLINEMTREPTQKYLPYPVNYYEKWLVPPLAIFIGTFIVLYASGYGFWIALGMWEFWVADIPSIAAAWLMMAYIVKRTYALDGKHRWLLVWWPRPAKRVWLQCYEGIVIPGAGVLFFYAFYFVVRGRPNLFWRYLVEDFTFVLLLLLGFAVLLWVYYHLQAEQIIEHWNWTRRRKVEKAAEAKLWPGVEVTPYGERIKDRIALFEPSSQKNKTSAVGFDGKVGVDLRTLIEIDMEARGYHYFMVHRSLIVNRSIILEVRKTDGAVFIVLDRPRKGEVRVSNGRREGFEEWFSGG